MLTIVIVLLELKFYLSDERTRTVFLCQGGDVVGGSGAGADDRLSRGGRRDACAWSLRNIQQKTRSYIRIA